MTHRSGSRLMLTTLKYFFDIIKMEYEYIGYYDLLEFTTKYKRRKFFILTRDPIERFVSGYTWLKKNLDKRDGSKVHKRNDSSIERMNKYYNRMRF
jgi:hypothetical protein